MTLGVYLMQQCFDPANMNHVIPYIRSYAHHTGRVNVTVTVMSKNLVDDDSIITWGCCRETGRQVTPVSKMSNSLCVLLSPRIHSHTNARAHTSTHTRAQTRGRRPPHTHTHKEARKWHT